MRRTMPHGGMFTFFVRSIHFLPASREIHTLPSFVPAQTTPCCVRDGAIAEIDRAVELAEVVADDAAGEPDAARDRRSTDPG